MISKIFIPFLTCEKMLHLYAYCIVHFEEDKTHESKKFERKKKGKLSTMLLVVIFQNELQMICNSLSK